jgi:hypothetical protein
MQARGLVGFLARGGPQLADIVIGVIDVAAIGTGLPAALVGVVGGVAVGVENALGAGLEVSARQGVAESQPAGSS